MSFVNEQNKPEQIIAIYTISVRDYLNISPVADIKTYNLNGMLLLERNNDEIIVNL